MDIVPIKVRGQEVVIPEPRIDAIPIPIPRPYKENAFRLINVGPSGSGKTLLLVNLLTRPIAYGSDKKKAGVFDRIYIFCPTYETDMTLNQLTKPGKDGTTFIDPDAVFLFRDIDEIEAKISELELQINAEIVEQNTNNIAPIKTLMVFDDLTNELKNSQKLKDLFTKGRKNEISMVVMTNQYKAYAPQIRTNATHYAIFKPSTTQELKDIVQDLPGDPKVNLYVFDKVFKQAPDAKPFVFVDKRANPKDMFWYMMGKQRLVIK